MEGDFTEQLRDVVKVCRLHVDAPLWYSPRSLAEKPEGGHRC